MSDLLVVGSVALDSVKTPFGEEKEILGGSATYFSTAIAAVVASPTAVVIWRVSCCRRSPAA